MKFRILVLILVLSVAISFSVDREIYTKIYVQYDGSAKIEYLEKIYGKELMEIYEIHAKYSSETKETQKEFFKELAKEFYLLYGTTPEIKSYRVEYQKSGDHFERKITAFVNGLIRSKDEKLFVLPRKHFNSEKDMIMYFENRLDGKFFESAFLESVKISKLQTIKVTEIVLPKGSEIHDLLPTFGRKPMEKWDKNFGNGNIFEGHVELEKGRVIVKEVEQTGVDAPDVLLKDENASFFDSLRDFASFDLVFSNERMHPKKLTKPVPYDPKSDFSRGWNYGISLTISHEFKYDSLKVKPGITFGVNLGIHLMWKYRWKKISWYRYKYVFDRFEGKVSINPYTTVFVNLHSEKSKSKSWTKNLIRKQKYFTFWVSGVPVVIVLVGSVTAKAGAGVSGAIDVNVSTKFNVNTSVTYKYHNGWGVSFSKSYSYSGIQFSATAKVNAWAKGELPIAFRGYVYNVAGPYVRFTPWLKGETDASVGTTNQVGYKVTGGLKVNGGVQMAGWLRKICGNIGSRSYELWSKTWTLKSGTFTF